MFVFMTARTNLLKPCNQAVAIIVLKINVVD